MKHPVPFRDQLRHPGSLIKGIRDRWPNPIKATIDMGWPLNNMPRLPVQLGYSLSRTARFISQALPYSRRKSNSFPTAT
jgi:hypothetical protein